MFNSKCKDCFMRRFFSLLSCYDHKGFMIVAENGYNIVDAAETVRPHYHSSVCEYFNIEDQRSSEPISIQVAHYLPTCFARWSVPIASHS